MMHWYRVSVDLPSQRELGRASNITEVVRVDASLVRSSEGEKFIERYAANRYSIFVQATDAVDAITRAKLVDVGT